MTICKFCTKECSDGHSHDTCWREMQRRYTLNLCAKCGQNSASYRSGECETCTDQQLPYRDYPGGPA